MEVSEVVPTLPPGSPQNDCTDTNTCKEFDVRLTSYPRGNPMVYKGGHWWPICSLDFFPTGFSSGGQKNVIDSMCQAMGYLGRAGLHHTRRRILSPMTDSNNTKIFDGKNSNPGPEYYDRDAIYMGKCD